MHIFKLKEGSKSFEWVKDVIDKERKQNAEIKRLKDEIAFLKAEYKAVAGCDIKDAF